jgi:hypothetical protein
MNDDPNTQPDEDDPLGGIELPDRPSIGARVAALAGSTVGIGVFAVVGAAANTGTLPTPWTR